VLALSLVLFNVIDHLARTRAAALQRTGAQAAAAKIGGRNPFTVVLSNPYLLGIGLMVLVLNWVNATGEYILGRIVVQSALAEVAAGTLAQSQMGVFVGGFFAQYFQVVNLAGMLLQLFVVSRLISIVGIPVAICVLPVMAFGSYLAAALFPVLAAVRWVKTVENSMDYSLQNTVSHMLYLPTTREEKYKAKQTIDTFFVRFGDVLSAVTVYAGATWLTLGVSQFAFINVALVLVWIALAAWVGRRFNRLVPATGKGV